MITYLLRFYSCLCVILTFHFLATDTGLNLFGGGGVGGGRGRMGLKIQFVITYQQTFYY